jgi:hypothetical protein
MINFVANHIYETSLFVALWLFISLWIMKKHADQLENKGEENDN